MAQNPGHRSLLILFLIFSFFMSGCSTIPELNHPNSKVPIKFTHKIIVGPLTLFFPENTPEEHRKLLTEGAMIQLAEFETDWGNDTKPVSVFFFNAEWIPCGNIKGEFWGCHHGPNGPIHIVMGRWMSATVLYHELIHHNYPINNDHLHKDMRWDMVWNPKQKRIWEAIRNKHREILTRK